MAGCEDMFIELNVASALLGSRKTNNRGQEKIRRYSPSARNDVR